ncbi:hypothetical protein [Providencia huashanensis]
MKNFIRSVFLEKKETPVAIVWFGFLRLISFVFSFAVILLGIPYTLGKIFYNEITLGETLVSGYWLFLLVISVSMLTILVGTTIYSLGTNGMFYKENK